MMLHHIELCLDEIECEVEFHLSSSMSELDRLQLKSKIDDLRSFVGALASAAHEPDDVGFATDEPVTGLVAACKDCIPEPVPDQVDTVEVVAEDITANEVVAEDDIVADVIAADDESVAPELGTELDNATIASAVETIDETAPAANAASDDLTMIRGIDAATATALAAQGIDTFATIADWRASDILAVANDDITARRIAQQCWIEQAAILATGQLTDFAIRMQRGEIAALVDLPEPVAMDAPEAIIETDDPTIVEPVTIGTVEINATKASFLPPVFESVTAASKQPVVQAEAHVIKIDCKAENDAPDLAKAACDAAEASAKAEVVALMTVATPVAKPGWVGRMSLAASLILLLSVGILGIESKLPTAALILHVVSAD